MTAQAIGSLYARLGLDSAQFDTGIDKARGKLGAFGKVDFSKGIKSGLGEIEDGLASLNGGLGAAGGLLSGLGLAGVAAGAAIAAAFAGARDAMAFGDEIGDTANKLKVSTDYLQEMRFAAHQLGGDFQDADAALEGFTKTFGLASSGLSSKALKPFTALGLDPKTFTSVEQALKAVIDKISQLGSVAEQAAVADKLGLTPLLPAIREGTASIDGMRKAAHDMGYVMDAELIDKAGKANDEYEALSRVLDVEFKSAMGEAIPLVMELTRLMVSGAHAAGDFARGLTQALGVGQDPAELARQGVKQADAMLRLDPNNTVAKANKARFQSQLDNEYKSYVATMDAQRAAALDHGAAAADLASGLEREAKAESAAREAAQAHAQAQREAAAAERKRLDGLLAMNAAMRELEQKSADYAASLLDDIVTMGMSTKQLKERQMAMEIAAAPTEALRNLMIGLRDQYVAQVRVGEEWAEVQKTVNAQMAETITTIHDAIGGSVHLQKTWKDLAEEAGKLSDQARELRYDIDDIAYAINNNDWVTAFAGLASVLAQVQKAFSSAATAKDKFQAAAMVANAVGGAVGGTAGSAISGAASGALVGMQLGGPVGAAIGGALGFVGGIFGSSKAKKKAKAQAEAQRQAEEAQRQQTIADTKRQLEIDLLRAQGKEVEAVALERQTELEALTKLDASLAAQKQAYYDAVDAAKAKADAEALAAQVTEKRQSIQDAIDKLTLSDAELLAKARAEERAEAVALDPALGDLIDKLFNLQDAATQAALAAQAEEAQAKAVADAYSQQQQIADYLADQSLAKVTAAYEEQAKAAEAAGNALAGIVNKFVDLSNTLNTLADTLGGELTGMSGRAGYAAARARLMSASGEDTAAAAQAFLELSKSVASSREAYNADLLFAQGLIRQRAASALGTAGFFGSLFSSGGVPGFANGGSLTLGGATGVDQNLLSLNGAPLARVGYGETLSVQPAGVNDNMGGGWGRVVAAVAALDQRLESIERSSAMTEKNTYGTKRNLNRVIDGDEYLNVGTAP